MVGVDDAPLTPWDHRIGGRDVRMLLMRWRGIDCDEPQTFGVATYDPMRPSVDCRQVSASSFRRYMP